MSLKGSLKEVGLAQLLSVIGQARKSGALHLSRPPISAAKLFFREGRLVHAVLDGRSPDLTTLLVQQGKIDVDQQQSILSRAKVQSEKEIGLLLIGAGYTDQATIEQALRSHMLEVVYPLFQWSDGTFSFEPADRPHEDRITVAVHLEGIIAEAKRRAQEQAALPTTPSGRLDRAAAARSNPLTRFFDRKKRP